MNLIIRLFFVSLLFVITMPAYSQALTIKQVIQNVIDKYPSVRAAALQVEKAKQEILKVESQLGWQLSAQAGVSHNVSVFNIASNTLSAGGAYAKLLDSGSTVSLDASLIYDDADTSFAGLPNPTATTNLNLNFRTPLKKGADNPAFEEGRFAATTGVTIKQAERSGLYDQLASTVIEIYLAAAITRARIDTTNDAVVRSKRLQKFIKNREKLGIAEEKDTLQVNAQLKNQLAELSGLNVIWEKQRMSLNRLMAAPIKTTFEPSIKNFQVTTFEHAYEYAKKHSPLIKSADSRIRLAESAIRLRRDANEDQLDLVLFVGARNQSGDLPVGSSNESDIVAGAQLEFLQQQDKSGQDAELYQAQLDRGSAIEDKRQAMEDLYYDIASLHAEILASQKALYAHQKSVDSEKLKLEEAEQRYKTGRADTDQIIQFENQLSSAKFSYQLQRIELSRRLLNLDLKQGMLWKGIDLLNMNDLSRQKKS